MTIEQFISLKNSTIEEFLDLAKQKGLNLPKDPNYTLSPSELKTIDPILAFNTKHNKPIVARDIKKREEIKHTRAKENTSDSKNNIPKRLIGVVKFYDDYKDFGFIITNGKEVEDIVDWKESFYSFYISDQEWKSSSYPKEKEWVILTPQKDKQRKNKWNATNVERLEFNKDTLLLAMKYRGKYAKIEGKDWRSNNIYNYNILIHIIQSIVKKNPHDKGKYIEILESFCIYLSHLNKSQKEQTIQEFLSDRNLVSLLFVLLSETSKDPTDKIYFDYSTCIELTESILIEESIKKDTKVKPWLSEHLEVLDKLHLKNDDIRTIPLRLILADLTDNNNWITSITDNWEIIISFIQETGYLFDLCTKYFLDRDDQFVLSHKITNILDNPIKQWCLEIFNSENCERLKSFLKFLVSSIADKDIDIVEKYILRGYDYSSFIPKIGTLLNEKIKENSEQVRSFIHTCREQNISIDTILPKRIEIGDELDVVLFVETSDIEYLKQIKDFKSCNIWIKKQPFPFIVSLIRSYISLGQEESNLIGFLDKETIAFALANIDTKEQYNLIYLFKKELALQILSEYFSDTELFDLYIEDLWSDFQHKIPYTVFDLETDGNTIKEFAFLKEGNTYYYQKEKPIHTLLEIINTTPIIVGHRIKQWDLEILKSYGKISPIFVWDTLEMEILLNPCRHAYSLYTAHNAKDDTELTDKLFWNQLFRLSQDRSLCTKLTEFLSKEIFLIIEKLRDPLFVNFLPKIIGKEKDFYHNLNDIDDKLIEKLSIIDKIKDEKVLLIAPNRLWNKIAEHIHVSFHSFENWTDYLPISKENLLENPLDNMFLQEILLRFISLSKTPIVSNLASYLRLQYFDDSLLLRYVENREQNIICSDLRIIDSKEIRNYDRIYFIGCEGEDVLNQYSLPNTLKTTNFFDQKSTIPMRFGGSNYTYITQEERASILFSDVPKDAANVWIERDKKGNYTINYNYNLYEKLKNIKLHSHSDIEFIPWISKEKNNSSITLVYSGKPTTFDYTQKRVGSTTRYRSMYWLYQLALLSDIKQNQCSLPSIYILEDSLEIENIENYALSLGFYIPKEVTLINKLQKIANHPKGLLITSKDKFFEIAKNSLPFAFCYIWDQMAVEKHMIMWRNSDSISKFSLQLSDKEDNEDHIASTLKKDTYQSVLSSLWPIYSYYNQFITANNTSSQMYILDPFLEEYHTLADIWGTKTYSCSPLWSDENTFCKNLNDACSFFKDESSSTIPNDDESIHRAMDVILETLITQQDDKGKQWKPIQKAILPDILKKQDNYLISIPTGGGKSVLFQGPALYNASFSNKLSLVITPLRALMQDQVKDLFEKGFYTNVDFINSDKSYQEIRSIYRKINGGELALLYITPERFRSRSFLNALTTRMNNDKGLEYIIFDEAHCISQWGMEFRPEYLNAIKRCKEFQKNFEYKFCITMFSATVTDMIYNHINEVIPIKRLGQENDKKVYNPIRSHIKTEFKFVEHDIPSRLEAIVEYITNRNIDFSKSRMLIFCKTRKLCEDLSISLPDLLVQNNILEEDEVNQVGYFHAGLDAEEREDTYSKFKSKENPIYILCATKAFGMGMDIPNIHYIVHLSPPNVLEDYLQEVGRAGRNKSMYELAGFNEENPIPTVCLFSKEDIKKSREQLLQSTLSWKNIEEIRNSIINFIKPIRSIEETREYPVIIPNNLWRRDEHDHDYTNLRLGEYWLERMNRIRLGYLSPACISITIKQTDINKDLILKEKDISKIFEAIEKIAQKKGNNTIQVSIQDLASDLSMPSSKVINQLILLVKYKLITINQEVRCSIANTRHDEVAYMLKNENIEVAFHIIFNTARLILEDNKINIEKSYSDKEIKDFIYTESLDKISISVTREIKNKKNKDTKNETEIVKYMPWYNEYEKDRNKGFSIARNYKKDLYEKRIRYIFSTLFDIIPDIKCKSYIDRDDKAVKQSIFIEKNTWKTFLSDFQNDCWKTLKYIWKTNHDTLNWANVINELKLEYKGYYYFENIIRYLSNMSYITTENLLPTGIEVYTTEDTNSVILEELPLDNKDLKVKNDFDEAILIRNLRLCIMEVLTTKVNSKKDFQELISAYFSKTDANGFIELLSKYYPNENDPFWGTIRETAIKNAEEKMKDNPEQWAIYSENSNTNINVEAGPGSGKTHLLTMRCAKLIYRQHVPPNQILVLAYNRAVVVELKSRLSKLFSSLGLSRSASQLHVYTFHGLAKKICGDRTLEDDMSKWESILLNFIRNEPKEVTKILPDIKYVLIDEFQDITQTRLDAMFELNKIYNQLTFFTIGDRDQSIYGFEKKESVDPDYYYRQLYNTLNPKRMTMTTNYRSYPRILSEASKFLGQKSKIPEACRENRKNEPKDQYTFIYYDNERNWFNDFENNIKYLKSIHMEDVAVFFRTNNEVFHGYSLIRSMNIPDVRIRIQGASECELFRKREIFAIINWLEKESTTKIIFQNDETKNKIKEKVSYWINRLPRWDSFYLDFAYTLVLDYLDFVASDEEEHTYGEMAEAIKLSLQDDNPQLYKLYDKYKSERILQDKQMNVILTTMHKVKGLEFDAVIITPSSASLPLNIKTENYLYDTEEDIEAIEEEKRLLYVAFTRAKKFLIAFLGERENRIIHLQTYEGQDSTLGIREKTPGLDNYNIGYNANYNFENNSKIAYIEKNAPVSIIRRDSVTKQGKAFHVYDIHCNNDIVGQLSKSSSIVKAMDEKNISFLSGFFVSDIFYWTYQDTLNTDNKRLNDYRNNPEKYNYREPNEYASNWCEEAKKQGYIFIVSISGYGH